MRAGIILATVLVASGAQAQQAPNCAAYAKAVEDGQKQLSYSSLSSDYAYMQVTLATVQANVALMAAARCTPPNAVRMNAYQNSALECFKARKDENPPACDRSKWIRED
jgi:hypothetical protein